MLISLLVFIWLVAVVIQLYFWLMVVWPLETYRQRRSQSKEPVSVIVCANAITEELPALINAILSQEFPDFELILVNDGPDDAINSAVSEYRQDARLKVIAYERGPESSPGKKAPLAFGLRHAVNEWILLTDSDCVVRQGWIDAMMSCTSGRSKMVLGFSPMGTSAGLASAISAFDTIYIGTQFLGWALRGRAYMGVGRNILYHKSLYEDVGGFKRHEDLASGDDDLLVQEMARLTRTEICLDDSALVYSRAKTRLTRLIHQKLRHISTADRYDRGSSHLVWIMGASYTVFWLFLIPVVILAFGIPMLIAAVAVVSQWWVFFRVSKKLEAQRFVTAFPLWSLLYAGFLIYLGLLKALGRTPQTWN